MTTSTEPTTTTTCPDWCPERGNHEWYIDGDVAGRSHRLLTGDINGAEVAVEQWDNSITGTGRRVVELHSGSGADLDSAEAVAAYVTAVQDAAAVAFPTDPAIRVRAAEQAVLKAVSDWCNGYGPQGAIGDAHDALANARCDLPTVEANRA